MWDRHSLQKGMKVRSASGRRVGTIAGIAEGRLLTRSVQRRRWVPLEDVEGIQGGVVRLARGARLTPAGSGPLPHPMTSILPLPP